MRPLVWLGLLALALGVSTYAVAARDRDVSAPPALPAQPPTRTERAADGATAPTPAARGRDFVGVFVAGEAVDLAPSLTGRVATLHAVLGERVHAGQLLATLDARAGQLDLAVARAQEREAAADLAIAESLHDTSALRAERQRSLREAGLSSGEEHANAEGEERATALRAGAARAAVVRQRARVERLARDCDEASIRAPFEGVIVARYVERGAYIGPERPLLRLVRGEASVVRFAVPEERAAAVTVGTRVHAVAHGTGARAEAVVRRIAPEIDAVARWYVVEAELLHAGTTVAGAAADVTLAE